MIYANDYGNDRKVGEATFTGGVAVKIQTYYDPLLTTPHWTETRTYGIPSPYMAYDPALDEFYYTYMDMETMQMKTVYSVDKTAHWEIFGEDVWYEGAEPEVRASYFNSDWQTDLKCNTGKSFCKFVYPTDSTYYVYLNGELYRTLNSYDSAMAYIRSVTYTGGVYTTGGQGDRGASGTYVWEATGTSTEFDFENLTCNIKGRRHDFQSADYAEADCEVSGDSYSVYSNIGSNFDPGGNECNVSFSFSCRPFEHREISYRYQVDNENLRVPNTAQLHFQAEDIIGRNPTTFQPVYAEWYGLTSPTYTFKTNSWQAGVSVNITQKNSLSMDWIHAETPSEVWTFANGRASYVSKGEDTFPTQIGGIKCLNPQIINDYEQDATDPDRPWEEKKARNTIIKIEPELNYNSVELFKFQDGITLADKDDWECVNCTKQGDIVTVNSNDGSAYIYQDFVRDAYEMEGYAGYEDSPEAPTSEYRQRHWCKARYCTAPLYKLNENTHTYERATVPIRLICKAYGNSQNEEENVKETVWTLGYDMWNENKSAYDMLMINNKCRRNLYSECDDLMVVSDCERLKVWDSSKDPGEEGYGWKYYLEKPITEAGYLPNIVGRIKIKLPKGKYQLRDMKTKVDSTDFKHYCKDEFRKPENIGCRMPVNEFDIGDTDQDYDVSRYIVGVYNGVKTVEIPNMCVTRSGNYQVDWYAVSTVADLLDAKTERGVYPRDDLREIDWSAIQDYEPIIGDNVYPIQAMADGKGVYVYWLKGDGLEAKPRFDYLSGNELYRYIGQNRVFKCVTEYGGLVHGNVNNGVSIQDNSPYNNDKTITDNRYYENENVGCDTTVSIGTHTRNIAKVFDGGKFWTSNVFRELKGKIWRSSFGKILREEDSDREEKNKCFGYKGTQRNNRILRGDDYE